MIIKKLILAVAAAALTIPAVACGSSESSGEKSSAPETSAAAEEDTSAEETTEAVTDEPTSQEQTTEAASDAVAETMKDLIADEDMSPAMWKATDPATGNHIFLMGTVHVAPKGEITFPDYVNEAYDSCDSIALEYDPRALISDMSTLQEYLTKLIYTDGTTVKEHLSPEAYELAVKNMKDRGIYNSMLDYYHVGFWVTQAGSSSLTDLGSLSVEGIDWKFADRAEKDGKEIINIETIDIQASAVTAISDDYASYMILSGNENTAEQIMSQYIDIYNCWATGRVDEMIDIEEPSEDLPDDLLDDYADYMDVILDERNLGMADAAESYIKDGKNCLFMVGALHFSGDTGVDDLLADRGYTVERVDR